MSDPYRGYDRPEPGLWLGLSIGSTLLCCLPLGIVGIVFSAMALDANSRGDYVLARSRTDQAKTWTLLSIGAGVAGVLFVLCMSAGR